MRIADKIFRPLGIDAVLLKSSLEIRWRKFGRRWALWIAAAIYLVLHGLYSASPAGQTVSLNHLDRLFFIRGERELAQNVAMVRIDRAVYKKLGLLPSDTMPRGPVAQALEQLSEYGPKLVVFDAVFSKRPDDQGSRELSEAMRKMPLVIGESLQKHSERNEKGERREVIVPLLSEARFIDAADDSIAFFLRAHKGVARWITIDLDSSSVFGSEQGSRASIYSEDPVPLLGPLRKHFDPSIPRPGREDFINFYGGPFAIPSISMADLIEPHKPLSAEMFLDKAVFIGFAVESISNLSTKRDTFLTSYSKLESYGVEIQATIAANLLDRSWIRRIESSEIELAIEWLLLSLFVYATLFRSAKFLLVFYLTINLIWFISSYIAFTKFYFFLPCSPIFYTTLPIYMLAFVVFNTLRFYRESQILKVSKN